MFEEVGECEGVEGCDKVRVEWAMRCRRVREGVGGCVRGWESVRRWKSEEVEGV